LSLVVLSVLLEGTKYHWSGTYMRLKKRRHRRA
jgi:hypothetical protein